MSALSDGLSTSNMNQQVSPSKTPPVGSELTMQQLLDAALWKNEGCKSVIVGGERWVAPFGLTSANQLACTNKEDMGLIHSTQRLLAQLTWQHNSTRPINCLPVEILTLIFHTICNKTNYLESTVHRFPSTCQRPDLRWLGTLTAVCRHWRSIALSNPSYWREIWVDGDTTIPTLFYHRSWPLPVRITFHNRTLTRKNGPDLDLEFLTLLGQNPQRLEGLSMYSPTFRALETSGMPDLLQNAFPNLQYLLINCEHSWRAHTLMSELFAPKLEHLSLSSIDSIFPQLFKGLTSLSLVLDGKYILDVPRFIGLLRLSRGLRVLRLDAYLPTDRLPMQEYQEVKPLPLPLMQEIDITNRCGNELKPFFPLHKLHFPSSTYVEWNGLCCPPESALPPQPSFLDQMKTLLLSAKDIRHKARDDLILLHRESFLQFHLPNIRILALHKSMGKRGDYLSRRARLFPFVEECHIPAANATANFLVSLDRSNLYRYPRLTTLNIWLDSSDSIEKLFDVSRYIQSNPKYSRIQELVGELAETGAAFWLGLDESRYCMINIRYSKDLVNMEPLTWEWMVAQSSGRS